MLGPQVQRAVDELRDCFAGLNLLAVADGVGGARVLVEGVALSPIYVQEDTWLGAHLPVQIPYADIYPLFVRGDLARRDGRPLAAGFGVGHAFMDRPAVQVSRRSNARDPLVDTPCIKFLKVIEWIRTQP